MRGKTVVRGIVLAMSLGLVAAACTSNNAGGGGGLTRVQGGKAVFGAEQWPQCINPITSCDFSTWTQIVALQPVLPKAMMVDVNGSFVASPLLTTAPTTQNGGITTNPFTVTFHINPKAVWSDGTPITSADFEFTWKAVMNTTGSTSKSGYDKIKSIDTSDPHTAVITFTETYADWADLFGGANINGYVIEKAAFPKANPTKPDLKDEMNDGITFSGGPWMIQSFSKSQEILVPNAKYWGHHPILDQVTFIPLLEQPTEITSILSGESSVIFPQASNVSLTKQFATNPNVKSVSGPTNYDDALWLNLKAPPLNDPKVRLALMYAVDRQAVVDQIIKLNDPTAKVLNCAPFWFPNIQNGLYCDQSEFAKYTYNPTMSKQILQSDGYDCSKTPCTKNGQPLTIIYYTTAGNTRREATQAVLKEKAIPAGFNFQTSSINATNLFSNKLTKGAYTMADYAGGGVVDPTVTASLACNQQPTAQNGYSGGNTDFYCNHAADRLMTKIDTEVNVQKRAQYVHKLGNILAQDIPAIPLYQFVNITAWRTDKIGGPIGTWNEAPYGTYWNMDYWYLVK